MTNCCTYFCLYLHIFFSLIISLIFSFVGCVSVKDANKILNFLQLLYLMIFVFIFIIITIWNIMKMILIPLKKIPGIQLTYIWVFLYIPAFIVIFIAIIYDIVLLFQKSELDNFLYDGIFIFLSFLFIILASIEYCQKVTLIEVGDWEIYNNMNNNKSINNVTNSIINNEDEKTLLNKQD